MHRGALWLALVLGPLCAAPPAFALDLDLPANASETANRETAPDSARIPVAPFADGELPALSAEGRVTQSAYRVSIQGITTLQLIAPLREQIEAADYQILLECAARECGGFDFRFALKVLPEPEMHVDLFEFRFLSAEKETAQGTAYIAILASRSSAAGFIQITQVTPLDAPAPKASTGSTTALRPTTKPQTPTPGPAANLPLPQALEAQGHAVLSDLAFETGSAALGEGRFGSLETLADWLKADGSRRIALVGHTDAVGSLEGNIALSKRRAASVLERLATAHDVPRRQMEAEGMGYLAPITTNRTPEGREENRRVEVILLNTE